MIRSLYSCGYIKQLIDIYTVKGGKAITVEEGVLGYGFMIMFGKGLKTIIVKEVYLNAWSSAHSVRKYKQIPKKYEKIIKEYCTEIGGC